jgi:type 1 glutamine amidotransferase
MNRHAGFLAGLLALTMISPALAEAPKKLLLIGQGPDGHPANTHEYVAGLRILEKLIGRSPGLEVMSVRADGLWREGPELIDRSDGVVLFLAEGAKWTQTDAARKAALDRLAKRGGGIAVLHWAMGTKDAAPIDGFLKLAGACHGGPDRKYKVIELEAQVADTAHPIARGISPKFRVKDEFYYQLKQVKPEGSIKSVLRVPIDGNNETVAWSWERPDGGRSFGFSGLHFHDNWKLPEYRRLVAQGVLWTMKVEIPEEGINVDIAPGELRLQGK